MQLPGWLIPHGIATALAYTANFFFSNTPTPETGLDIFGTVGEFITFQGIPGLPGWFSFLLFVIFPLPWLFILAAAIVPILAGLASSTAGALIVGTVLVVTLGTIILAVLGINLDLDPCGFLPSWFPGC